MSTNYFDHDLAATAPITDDDYLDHCYEVDLANEQDHDDALTNLADTIRTISGNVTDCANVAHTLGYSPTVDRPDEACWYVTWSETVLGSRVIRVQSWWSIDDPQLRTSIELDGTSWEGETDDLRTLIDALAEAQSVYDQVTAKL